MLLLAALVRFDVKPSPSHLESAENRSHPLLQAVPPLVPLVDQDFELAGGVSPVLPGQAAILFVDQLQLSQTLMDLPLERLRGDINIIQFNLKQRAPNMAKKY